MDYRYRLRSWLGVKNWLEKKGIKRGRMTYHKATTKPSELLHYSVFISQAASHARA